MVKVICGFFNHLFLKHNWKVICNMNMTLLDIDIKEIPNSHISLYSQFEHKGFLILQFSHLIWPFEWRSEDI